jgi:hypothetical protein
VNIPKARRQDYTLNCAYAHISHHSKIQDSDTALVMDEDKLKAEKVAAAKKKVCPHS